MNYFKRASVSVDPWLLRLFGTKRKAIISNRCASMLLGPRADSEVSPDRLSVLMRTHPVQQFGIPRGFIWLSVLLIALPTTSISTEVYRWVDAEGKVHYSDRPGPSPTQEVVNLPAANVAAPLPPMSIRSETSQTAPNKEKTSPSKEEATKRCNDARDRLTFLEERIPNRIMITGEDGKPARMTVERWELEKKKARDRMTEYCQ